MKLHLTTLLTTSALCFLSACHGGTGDGDKTPPALSDKATNADITVFESGHVRPLAINADASRLYAVNTPDNTLEIFNITHHGLVYDQSVSVGMEPVSVNLDNQGRAWVVNHLSDNVSIIDITVPKPVVNRTILVGDEPRDIVFAGPGNNKAFITTAHRGQNAPFDPQELTPGIGRADVWVFNVNNLGAQEGGTPVTITNMFGDVPRALAVSPDGNTVYAATLHSGNQTTTLFADRRNGALDKPTPHENVEGTTAPETGLIVKFNGTDWMGPGDPTTNTAPKVWSDRVKFSLPDYDVFEIDATAAEPVVTQQHSGVGTTLFNMTVNPTTGQLYVSNTDALNDVRFEGHGSDSTTVRGDIVRTRITVIDDNNGDVTPRNLNKHITSYGEDAGSATENALSASQVLQMAVTNDGSTLYGAAFGNNKLIKLNTSHLEADTFNPSASNQAMLTGGGPTGVVLDEMRGKAYVLTRFDNGISTVDTNTLSETDHITMFNPEPDVVTEGRPFLYDASLSSSRGDSSCGSCHIFGDMDHLAWDLGDPDGIVTPNPREYAIAINAIREHHPMKGPMTTQSLRGLPDQGPMHWRGDRLGTSADADETLEEQAFEDFNPAFVGLLGRETPLTEDQMDAFAKFALTITYPPNPNRNLDNSLTTEQADGRNTYLNVLTTGGANLTCNFCHTLDPDEGHFGTDGRMSIEGNAIAEDMKIPHLRAVYQKVGRFGATGGANAGQTAPNMGDQIRGYGVLHDGSVDTINTFFGNNTTGQPAPGNVGTAAGFVFASPAAKANVLDFIFAFDSNLAPVIGHQVTLNGSNGTNPNINSKLDMLVSRAAVTTPRAECDLVGTGLLDGEKRGVVMNDDGTFDTDKIAEVNLSLADVKARATTLGNTLTFMCVPPGQGRRIGIDRDADRSLNADEIYFGSDPTDPTSFPEEAEE